MLYWLNNPQKEEEQTNIPEPQTKKTDARAKRIDSLRVYHQLDITLNSLGDHDRFYHFKTKDLSASGLFVIHQNLKELPFLINTTLIVCSLELADTDKTELSFISKIARMVYPNQSFPKIIPGFGLRIVQIDNTEKQILNRYITQHGEPDEKRQSESQQPVLAAAS